MRCPRASSDGFAHRSHQHVRLLSLLAQASPKVRAQSRMALLAGHCLHATRHGGDHGRSVPAAHDEHRARGRSYHPIGDAAHQQSLHAGAPVSAHDHEIDAVFLGGPDDCC
jgi:hypothetical protein